MRIPVNDIKITRPHKPSTELAVMCASIILEGVQRPIVVCEKDGKYEVIDGNARLQAARAAGKTHIECIVTREKDLELHIKQIIPSKHRVPTDPVSYAEHVQLLAVAREDFREAIHNDPGVAKWLRNPASGVPVSLKDIFKNL